MYNIFNFTNFLLIIIVLIILLYINHINRICMVKPEIFTYIARQSNPLQLDDAKQTNLEPNILIIGTTHGNEPVGYYAITKLMNLLNNKEILLLKGKLTLIPVVNYCGFKNNTRNIFLFNDINRQYHGKTSSIINKTIMKTCNDNDFILDFHEGWGFHKIDKSSIGSTITPNNTEISYKIAHDMRNNINRSITSSNKKFIIRTNDKILLKENNEYSSRITVKGTLSHHIEEYSKNNTREKHYILIETSGQNDIQPIDLRVDQAIIFIKTLLDYYDMI